MNSKVKKEMYTPMPRHRSGHEGSREIKSRFTTPSGGFAKTPHKFFSVPITKKNFVFANGKNFSFCWQAIVIQRFYILLIKDISTFEKFLLPTLLISLKSMTKFKGSLSILDVEIHQFYCKETKCNIINVQLRVKQQTLSPEMMCVIPMYMKLCKFNVSKINVNEN
jgi:hypothetical protein